jgi:hypothetical protein
MAAGPTRTPEPSEPARPPLDPALDPEIAELASRVAPSRSAMHSIALLGLGWAIALSLVLGLLGGLWLDGQLGTSPWLTIGGIALGLLGAYGSGRELVRKSRR